MMSQESREELTDEGNVEGQAAAQHYDGGLGVPIVVDVRHEEGDELCGHTMHVGTQPKIFPASPNDEG